MTPEEYEAMRASAVAHLKGVQRPEIVDRLRNLLGPIVYAQYEAQMHEFLFDAAMDLIARGCTDITEWTEDVASNRVAAMTALIGRHLFQQN